MAPALKREYAQYAGATDAQEFGAESETAHVRERFGAQSADPADSRSEFRQRTRKTHRPQTDDLGDANRAE
jgi:hypothetical protein